MQYNFISRIQNAWNAFRNKDMSSYSKGISYSHRPDRPRFTRGNERTIVTSIYNRIALDASSVDIKHVRLDEEDRYIETINSTLNECLNVSANVDQTGRAFFQDMVQSMLDEGCVAIVPTDVDISPLNTDSYKILEMRVGKIMEWFPEHVRVNLYNERTGKHEEIIVMKKNVAIVENPLYSVMNEPNSTLQRLIKKLNMLDVVDEENSSGKLNMIIQLPYIIKTEARRRQAEKRRNDIEEQLKGSKYGIAYTDGTETIQQLSRPVETSLMEQVEYLTKLLYSQLGITDTVMDGTADEKVMLNYYNRTIEPIVSAITTEFTRKFLTKTARSQKQTIKSFRDPFRLVPVANIAEIADKFTRNEIMSSNEIRQVIGMKPSKDPKADELVNSNIAQERLGNGQPVDDGGTGQMEQIMNEVMDNLEKQIDQIISDSGGDTKNQNDDKKKEDGDK